MIVKIARVAVLALLIGIVFSTLSPLGLRPRTILDPELERLGAYFLLGLAAVLAFPRHRLQAAAAVAAVAVGLELLQLIDPGRDGRLVDALTKLAGAVVGVACGWLVPRRDPVSS